jgi:hypothetical protein
MWLWWGGWRGKDLGDGDGWRKESERANGNDIL